MEGKTDIAFILRILNLEASRKEAKILFIGEGLGGGEGGGRGALVGGWIAAVLVLKRQSCQSPPTFPPLLQPTTKDPQRHRTLFALLF